MNPEDFRDQVLEALHSDDTEKLDELVSVFEPLNGPTPDGAENEALVAIGKFGCSGRTSRYRAFVETLIEKGLQPDLTTCAYFGLVDRGKALVDRNADLVNTQNGEGITPLHAAAERGDLAMTTWLYEAGADPRALSSDDELPIVRALHAGPWKSERALDVVDFLAPLCELDQELWFASGRGDVVRVKSLLRDPTTQADEPDSAGVAPLFHACHNNQADVVELLLEAGADPNRKTPDGDSPLATACLHRLSQECDISIIKALLRAGARQSIESAVIVEDDEFVRNYFELQREKPNERGPLTPLHYAIHTGARKSLELLVRLGVELDDGHWSHIERIFGSDGEYFARLRRLSY